MKMQLQQPNNDNFKNEMKNKLGVEIATPKYKSSVICTDHLMEFPSGEIISFEGLDCSFKETNYNKFVNQLYNIKKTDDLLFTESFPRYGNTYAEPLTGFLRNNMRRSAIKNNPMAVKSLFAIDRMNYWTHYYNNEFDKNKLCRLDFLNNNSCFVFDRYTLSNTIYNPLNGSSVQNDDVIFEKKHFGIPLPTIVIWMNMSNYYMLDQLLSKKKGKDYNETDTGYIREVWERSQDLFNNHKEYLINNNIYLINIECLTVDNDGDPIIRTEKDIFENIIIEINRKMNTI